MNVHKTKPTGLSMKKDWKLVFACLIFLIIIVTLLLSFVVLEQEIQKLSDEMVLGENICHDAGLLYKEQAQEYVQCISTEQNSIVYIAIT